MTAGGMADQARLLGEHDDVLVLIADVQGDVVGRLDGSGLPAARRDLDVEHVAGHHELLLGGRLVVYQDTAALDQAHDGAAAGDGLDSEVGDQCVQTDALLVCGNDVGKRLSHYFLAFLPCFASNLAMRLAFSSFSLASMALRASRRSFLRLSAYASRWAMSFLFI